MIKLYCRLGNKKPYFQIRHNGSETNFPTLKQAAAHAEWIEKELPKLIKRESKRELKSIHTSQNSFYGKAYIVDTIEGENTLQTVLYSYNTPVVTIDFRGGLSVSIPETFSKTTRRHIREFVLQQFDCMAWDIISAGLRNGKTWWDYASIR